MTHYEIFRQSHAAGLHSKTVRHPFCPVCAEMEFKESVIERDGLTEMLMGAVAQAGSALYFIDEERYAVKPADKVAIRRLRRMLEALEKRAAS